MVCTDIYSEVTNDVISVYVRSGRGILTPAWPDLGGLCMAFWSDDLGKDAQLCASCSS